MLSDIPREDWICGAWVVLTGVVIGVVNLLWW